MGWGAEDLGSDPCGRQRGERTFDARRRCGRQGARSRSDAGEANWPPATLARRGWARSARLHPRRKVGGNHGPAGAADGPVGVTQHGWARAGRCAVAALRAAVGAVGVLVRPAGPRSDALPGTSARGSGSRRPGGPRRSDARGMAFEGRKVRRRAGGVDVGCGLSPTKPFDCAWVMVAGQVDESVNRSKTGQEGLLRLRILSVNDLAFGQRRKLPRTLSSNAPGIGPSSPQTSVSARARARAAGALVAPVRPRRPRVRG